MIQEPDKAQFKRKVRKQGNSLQITIAKPAAQHIDLQEGDEIVLMTEHSEKIEKMEDRENGDYLSLFNETVQSGERK